MLTETEALQLAKQHNPGWRHLEVILFDPDNWPRIYDLLKFRWPAYDDPRMNCPDYLRGRRDVFIRPGDWIVYSRGPKRGEIIDLVIDTTDNLWAPPELVAPDA